MGTLSQYFSVWECACSCGECEDRCEMDASFLEQLDEARVIAGTSFTITSGFRCPLHPESVQRPTSSHPKGLAADIHTPTSRKRYKVLKGLIGAGFRRIGIGKEFIHVDADLEKAPEVTWDYY